MQRKTAVSKDKLECAIQRGDAGSRLGAGAPRAPVYRQAWSPGKESQRNKPSAIATRRLQRSEERFVRDPEGGAALRRTPGQESGPDR